MKTYLVGGAVRDLLLGNNSEDKDYVVIGATPSEMEKKGFKKVGKDFPVYLHPQTNEEYALARMENKTAPGHDGFEFQYGPEVTLKEDLFRRDLTINSIAMDLENNNKIHDPYKGKKDLDNKILRHVSEHFKEDPLRVLRVARFQSLLPEFEIAPETMDLMTEISLSGELETLSGERIFMEINKTLKTERPDLFFKVMKDCKALPILFPELNKLIGVPQSPKYHPEGDAWIHTLLVLQSSCELSKDPKVRFACLVHDLGKGETPADVLPSHRNHENTGLPLIENFCNKLKVPNKFKDLSLKVCKSHLLVHKAFELRPKTILGLLKSVDALRNPDVFEEFILCCQADNMGKQKEDYPQGDFIKECYKVVKNLDTTGLKEKFSGKKLGEEIDHARILAIKALKAQLE